MVGLRRLLRAAQRAIRLADVASGVRQVRRLQGEGPYEDDALTFGLGQPHHARDFFRGFRQPSLPEEDRAEVVAREDLAFGVSLAGEAKGSRAIEGLGAADVARPLHVAAGKREPEVLGMADHERVENAEPPSSQSVPCWATWKKQYDDS